MKILTIGDVVGDSGTAAVCERLGEIKEKYAADFCVVNGENACSANGISRRKAEMLLHAGADVLTLATTPFAKRTRRHFCSIKRYESKTDCRK